MKLDSRTAIASTPEQREATGCVGGAGIEPATPGL